MRQMLESCVTFDRSPSLDKTRADLLRERMLNHLIHHRGQLTVYLRLLDIPVTGMYGPSADEK